MPPRRTPKSKKPEAIAVGSPILRLCQARAEGKGAVGVILFADGDGYRAESKNGMEFKFTPPAYVARIQRPEEE